MKQGKTLYITCTKIFAMLLVMYGHFISVGTWATEIGGVINGTMVEPLIPSTTQRLWEVEFVSLSLFNIQFAIVGVVLFFLMSGYFIPGMQRRYNHAHSDKHAHVLALLLSRLVKFYPVMIICVILNGLVAYFAQGIQYSIADYIGTALLISFIMPVQSTMGVTWYLHVLVFSYIIATMIPKLTAVNLNVVYLFLFVCSFLPRILGNSSISWIAWNLENVSKYAGIVFLGTYVSLSKEFRSNLYRAIGFVWFFLLTFALQKVNETLYQNFTTYSEFNTYLFAFLIIAAFYGGCYLLRNHVNEKFQKVLFFIENVSFPYYLVHVHFGMISMYYLKQLGVNSYINVVCATIVSAVVAVLVTKLVTYIEGMSWYRKIGAKWTT